MLSAVKVSIAYYASSTLLLLLFGLFKVLHCLYFMEKPIETLIDALATIKLPKESYWKGLFGWKMLKNYQDVLLLELQREARTEKQSPNPSLVSIDGTKRFRLLDFSRGSRPLVVNFGSCTCPVFMTRLKEFGKIVEEFGGIADFVTVYIKEVHPTDEWKLEGNIEIPQHRSQQERCSAAKRLLELNKLHPNSQLVVDTLEDHANKAFGAMPIRLFIIENGKVQYAGGIGPTFYKTKDVRKWLSDHRGSHNRKRA